MLTSNDSLEIAVKALQHGACDYVVKTETKFKKINYSLSNLFKIMEAKNDARLYKNLLGIFFCVMALVVGGIIVIQIFQS